MQQKWLVVHDKFIYERFNSYDEAKKYAEEVFSKGVSKLEIYELKVYFERNEWK